MNKSNHFCSHINVSPVMGNKQRGAVLVVGLLILLVLTIIGITGMTSTSMQERMSGNDRSRQIAFQSAEAALRSGEEFVRSSTYVVLDLADFVSGCANGLCARATGSTQDPWLDSTVWSNATKYRTYLGGYSETVSDPKFIIEHIFSEIPPAGGVASCSDIDPDCFNYFRITALGTGSTDTSRVLVQSIFKKEPE